jgi:hypothetical protein
MAGTRYEQLDVPSYFKRKSAEQSKKSGGLNVFTKLFLGAGALSVHVQYIANLPGLLGLHGPAPS